MGIKDDLAARNAGFVSLRELLERMCAHQGVTLKEAADWLSERLYQADEDERPAWCELTPGRGIFGVSGDRLAVASRALRYVLNNGEFAPAWEFDPDDIPF